VRRFADARPAFSSASRKFIVTESKSTRFDTSIQWYSGMTTMLDTANSGIRERFLEAEEIHTKGNLN
jgi:hypothetical protein